MRSLPLSALFLALTVADEAGGRPEDSANSRAPLGDRWSWNARERTETGIAALEKGEAERASVALETALRLRPDDPIARFNAGTGRLVNGESSASPLLESVATNTEGELGTSAWYNLGNARLRAGDTKGAIGALVAALKRRPDHADAKFNLELALRQQEQQEQREEEQKKQQEQGKEEQDSPGKDGAEDVPSEPNPKSPGESEPGEAPPAPAEGSPKSAPAGQPNGSPRFRDLPDMTAEQAEAILRAVENLERQERKERAARVAAAAPSVEIDW